MRIHPNAPRARSRPLSSWRSWAVVALLLGSMEVAAQDDGAPFDVPVRVHSGMIRGAGHAEQMVSSGGAPATEDVQRPQGRKKRRAPAPGVTQNTLPGNSPAVASTVQVDELLKSVVVVSTANGGASGFIALQGGKPYFFTNAHVAITIDEDTSLLLGGGGSLRLPATMEISDVESAADIVRFPLPANVPASLVVPAADQNIAGTGQQIVVLGNSAAGGVVPVLEGSVLAVGPLWVEYDAESVKGNSGGPIILQGTNTVVGMVTRYMLPDLKNDVGQAYTRFDQLRRVGIRPDKVPKWRTISLSTFQGETRALEEIQKGTAVLAAMKNMQFSRLGIAGINTAALAQTRIGAGFAAMIDSINSKANRSAHLSEASIKELLKRFVWQVRADYGAGVKDVPPTAYSAYHRESFRSVAQQRRDVCTLLISELENQLAQPMPLPDEDGRR